MTAHQGSAGSRQVLLVSPWYYGLERSIASAFERHGCSVDLHDYFPHDTLSQKVVNRLVDQVAPRVRLDRVTRSRRESFNRAVLTAARRTATDALVVVVKGDILFPEVVDEICSHRRSVYWGIDDPQRFPIVMETIDRYSAIFCFEKGACAEMIAAGLPTTYLPDGYDDLRLRPRPVANPPRDVDVSFVGARYPLREAVLREALSVGRLGIWGGDWKRRPWRARYYQPRTPLDRCARGDAERSGSDVYCTVPINLNIHGLGQGICARVFEIPGAGGFQLCDYRPSIDELFVPDKEIVLYSDVKDMKEKIAYYLRHPGARQAIAEAGHRRALAEHRWVDRAKVVLDLVKAGDQA